MSSRMIERSMNAAVLIAGLSSELQGIMTLTICPTHALTGS